MTVHFALRSLALGAAAALPLLGNAVAQEGGSPPFGTDQNVAYAEDLWNAMKERQLVGDDAVTAFPYEGTQPHGAILQTLRTRAEVRGHQGTLIVKRNYGPQDATITEVWNEPQEYLMSVTVMFEREEGYDPETNNWFWAKYTPDGSLEANQKGMELAGKVAKGAGPGGAHAGCIGCHAGAGGDDFIFTNDK